MIWRFIKVFLPPLLLGLFAASAAVAAPAPAVTIEKNKFSLMSDFSRAGDFAFDGRNQLTLAMGVSVFALARSYDPHAQDVFNGHHRLGEFETLGNEVVGTGVPGALIGLGLLHVGVKKNQTREYKAGVALLEALAVTGVATHALKLGVRRERPDQSDQKSFPSGHTSTAFALAAVVDEFYDWRWSAPLWGLASITAISRVADNRHWLSDTIAGATLGAMVGHAFSRAHKPELDGAYVERRRKPTWHVWLEPRDGDGRVLEFLFAI